MGLTRNGVCYQLDSTPYTYEWGGVTYHFSTEGHRAKFVRDLRKREMWLNDSMSRRFRICVSFEFLADIQLYCQIETRGFYIVTNDQCEYTSPAQILAKIDMALVGVVPDGTL